MDNTSKLIESIDSLIKRLEDTQKSAGSLDGLSQQFTDVINQQIDATNNQTAQLNDFSEQQKQIEKNKDKDKSKHKRQSQIMIKFQQQITKHLPNLTKLFSGFQKKLSVLTNVFSKFGSKLTGFFKNFKNPFAGLLKGKGSFLKNMMGGNGGLLKGLGSVVTKVKDFTGSFLSLGFQKVLGLLGPKGKIAAAFQKFIGFENILKKIPGFELMGKIFGGMWNNFKLAAKYGGQFAKVMVGLPLKIVGAMASKFGNRIRDDIVITIGNAVEATKEFFDVSSNLGKGLKGLADEGSKDLARTLNVRSEFVQLFGTGAEGISKFVGEISTGIQNMGPLADTVGATIAKNEVSAMQFVKATRSMGLSAEDVRFITAESVKNGESLFNTLDQVMVSINKTSKETNLDQKKMSRNFFKLRNDITNFGHLSNDQLMQTTAKITQMGLSMEEASAVFGKIDTFESAAQTSAMLSQTFGMNLDALQLLRAEKPEEIIEQFRDAMLSTGRSFDQLNRHEKALMAQHTGLSAESLKLTMNYRNLGLTHEEIQQKLKENDPTQQQIKNLESMNGSLQKMHKTMQGNNFFTSFADGVVNVITRSSGLTRHLTKISERMEDFFIGGLTISEKSTNALTKAFQPVTDVITDLVGDEKTGKKGLFDSDKMKSTFETFSTDMGNFLGRVFRGEDLELLQYEFSNNVENFFDFNRLDEKGNIVGQLFKTSGKFVGQFLKGFAAIGPGLIRAVEHAFHGLVDLLDGGGLSLLGGESVKDKLMKLFSINNQDANAIQNTVNHLVHVLTSQSGPMMRLIVWVNQKFMGIAADFGKAASEGAMKGVFGGLYTEYGKNKAEGLKEARQKGLTGDAATIKSLADAMEQKTSYNPFIGGDDEEGLAKLGGKMQYVINQLEQKGTASEKRRLEEFFKRSSMTRSQLLDVENLDDNYAALQDLASFLKGNTDGFNMITLKDLDKVKGTAQDAQGKLLGPGKMATLTATPGGLRLTQYAEGDSLVAAKPSEISYGGDAARGFQSMSNISAQQNVGQASMQGPSEIRVFMQVDGNTLTEVVLDNDLIRKATQRKNGRTTLADGTVIDSGLGRIQGSSLT